MLLSNFCIRFTSIVAQNIMFGSYLQSNWPVRILHSSLICNT
ncbi:hypothetical protein X975_00324, partial [Stegodyphus mimosarum]